MPGTAEGLPPPGRARTLDRGRVGGVGDLGVDVAARDDEDRLLIPQCRQYLSPVGSGHVRKFNGTASGGPDGPR
ncbi:restriction endonuclease [Streptomyces sp. NPDC003442]